ncbi:MAG TPA: hypothetical protein VN957_12685 [Chthoniobacterales bacterium]|nr:hypothetical protein [Chthoniobacterales bacterium]
MNVHLADGGYYDNAGVAALVQWLHNGLSDLADRNPTRLPKQILVIRINAFPAAEQGYVKEHRGTFFQFWAPLLTMNTFRGAAHACSADRELQLLRERWSGEVLAGQKGQHRDGVRIETVDFTFSPSATSRSNARPYHGTCERKNRPKSKMLGMAFAPASKFRKCQSISPYFLSASSGQHVRRCVMDTST